jgi:hypothetical protein
VASTATGPFYAPNLEESRLANGKWQMAFAHDQSQTITLNYAELTNSGYELTEHADEASSESCIVNAQAGTIRFMTNWLPPP